MPKDKGIFMGGINHPGPTYRWFYSCFSNINEEMGEDEDMKGESGLRQFLGGLTQVILLKSACFIETIGGIQSPNDGSLYNSRKMIKTPIQYPQHTKNYGTSQFSMGKSTINNNFQ